MDSAGSMYADGPPVVRRRRRPRRCQRGCVPPFVAFVAAAAALAASLA